ncbi:MAG: hypothetical protein M2R45_01714 [Verrucomicrobia subdivision 3 bacterium]|nr:hypothetical protein [Limisphaerales bacterium]MCS1413452.1 hypothetical protein [Limisphaerales bacterium]
MKQFIKRVTCLALLATLPLGMASQTQAADSNPVVDKVKDDLFNWAWDATLGLGAKAIPHGSNKAEHAGIFMNAYDYSHATWYRGEQREHFTTVKHNYDDDLRSYTFNPQETGTKTRFSENHIVVEWDFAYYNHLVYEETVDEFGDPILSDSETLVGEKYLAPDREKYPMSALTVSWDTTHRVFSHYSESGPNPPGGMPATYKVTVVYRLEDLSYDENGLHRKKREKEDKEPVRMSATANNYRNVDILPFGTGLWRGYAYTQGL